MKKDWTNLEKSLSEFTSDFMESGRNQPEFQKGVEDAFDKE